jgi:GAF domain-containing protein
MFDCLPFREEHVSEPEAMRVGLERGREALRRFLAGEDDLQGMLSKIALLAGDTVPACDLASITLMREGKATTPVFTDKPALDLDETQYRLGDGPCLAAIRHQGVEQVSIASDGRWPQFAAAASARGIVGVLSAPLVDEGTAIGGLNLYSKTTARFGDDAVEAASLFADQLGVAAARATVLAESYELATHLRIALESRGVIDQAKGILMEQRKVGPDEAFRVLQETSQRENRKLRAIAEEMVGRYARRD